MFVGRHFDRLGLQRWERRKFETILQKMPSQSETWEGFIKTLQVQLEEHAAQPCSGQSDELSGFADIQNIEIRTRCGRSFDLRSLGSEVEVWSLAKSISFLFQ